MEAINKQLQSFLSLPKLDSSPQEINSGTFAYTLHFQQFGITMTKFEVFAKVAVVNAKAPL